MAEIFERRRLTSGQLRTVAQRRFDDAAYLRGSRQNARANGVFYLGGFVVECFLKARLLDQYPSMGTVLSTNGLSPQDRALWLLIYRSHDLDEMLGYLPDLERKLRVIDQAHGSDWLRRLKAICAEWSIFARYSPLTETMSAASRFLDDVKELRQWLRP